MEAGRSSGPGKKPRVRIRFLALTLGAVLLLLAIPLFFPMCSCVPNETAVVALLHRVSSAETQYNQAYGVYSPTLAALGPPQAGQPVSASAADLVDGVLARGEMSGYIFTYAPGPPDAKGHLRTFTVSVRPREFEKTGRLSFFTDNSGVIRSTTENRPATASDSPVY